MSEAATIDGNEVLIVVDVQNDFCPGGALAVPRGDEIVPIVNRLAARFRNVVLTQDWHPPGHFSFASTHPGKKSVRDHRRTLWPASVVARPLRARHTGRRVSPGAAISRMPPSCCARAWIRTIDSYSAFYENDRKTPTGLVGYLRERGFSPVFLAGLAFDFCVRYSAEDAQREGFTVFVIEDACRGIDLDGSVAVTRASLATSGSPASRRWRPPEALPSGLRSQHASLCGMHLRQCSASCVQRTKIVDSACKSQEITKCKQPGNPMRHQTVAPPSSLPSLMMPCPVCAGRMVFHTRRPWPPKSKTPSMPAGAAAPN